MIRQQTAISSGKFNIQCVDYRETMTKCIYFKPNYKNLYSICQFDLNHTQLTQGSTIDCDNKHIKVGSRNGVCYAMTACDNNHAQGYGSGQHCFRMYYKNPAGPHEWLLFGVYQCGVKPKHEHTYRYKTSWGIADHGYGRIVCNGKAEIDRSMQFLYSCDENEIDMHIDFDLGILSYAIVDDNIKNRKYTFKKAFDTSILYTVNIGFSRAETEVQIAKINVGMFGKNKKLVKWPINKY